MKKREDVSAAPAACRDAIDGRNRRDDEKDGYGCWLFASAVK